MNRAQIFDAVQYSGVALIGGGTVATAGWGVASIVVGALLIGLTFLELHLLRRG